MSLAKEFETVVRVYELLIIASKENTTFDGFSNWLIPNIWILSCVIDLDRSMFVEETLLSPALIT